jgi:hypothetical protein
MQEERRPSKRVYSYYNNMRDTVKPKSSQQPFYITSTKERVYKKPPSQFLFPYEMLNEEDKLREEEAQHRILYPELYERLREEEAQQRILFPELFEGEEKEEPVYAEPVYAKPTLAELRLRETGKLLRPLSRLLEGSTAQKSYDKRIQEARELSLEYHPSPQNPYRSAGDGFGFLPYQPRLVQSRDSAFMTPQEQRRQRQQEVEARIMQEVKEKRQQDQLEADIIQQIEERRQAETGCIASGRPRVF